MDALKQFAPYASIVAIIVVIGVAFFVWANALTGDVAKLQSDVAYLTQGQDVIRQDIQNLREEIRQEIRLSKSDFITAVSGHRHDKEDVVIFQTPP